MSPGEVARGVPSSLIFAALAAAWLVVLVPMFARRRQEVARTTDTALAARVVRRGADRAPAEHRAPSSHEVEEAFAMPDTERDRVEAAGDDIDERDDGQWRRVHSDDARAGRRYRPGRGGFDPEAAALAARAKYSRRQRLVLGMLVTAVITGVAGAFLTTMFWWAHGVVDLVLVSYLTYLRRQVRIEEDIRHRRLARLSNPREADESDSYVEEDDYSDEEQDEVSDEVEAPAPEQWRREPPRETPVAHGVVVDIDDEDPMFDELDERTWEPYRRAVGE